MRSLIFSFAFFCLHIAIAQTLDYPLADQGRVVRPNLNKVSYITNNEIHYIPLKFHLVVDNASLFNDSTYVDPLLALINQKFIGADIEFYKCGGVNYIQSQVFANGKDPQTIITNLHSTHGDSNVINMYIANSTITFGGYSFSGPIGEDSYNVQFNGVVIDGGQYLGGDDMLPVHELGHYFGLYHPSDQSGGLELVDGSNCETTGDYCCDTPAEYGGMCCAVLPDCSYSPLFGIVTDNNGDTLNPDVTNIMSAMQYNTNCRNGFTNDQYERIKFYRENFLYSFSCPGSTIGVNEIEAFEFSLYPNPATESVSVSLPYHLQAYTIEVYSLTGVLLSEFKSISNANYTIDVSEFNSGIYIVKVHNSKIHSESLLVIK